MVATAILKFNFLLFNGQVVPDFDEKWYIDQSEIAEFKKRKTGSLSPFSKMAAAAILKINWMLPLGQLLPDFDEIRYTD